MGAKRREESLLKLVHPGGFVEIHKRPITAAEVMKKNPRHCVTRPDVFKYPWVVVRPESILKPGDVFYIVPNRTIYRLLQEHDNSNSQSPASSIDSLKYQPTPNPWHRDHPTPYPRTPKSPVRPKRSTSNLSSPRVKYNYFPGDDDGDDGGGDSNDEVTPTNKTNMQKNVSKQMPLKVKFRVDRIDDMESSIDSLKYHQDHPTPYPRYCDHPTPYPRYRDHMQKNDDDDGGGDSNDEVTPTNKTNMQKNVSKQMPSKVKFRVNQIDDMESSIDSLKYHRDHPTPYPRYRDHPTPYPRYHGHPTPYPRVPKRPMTPNRSTSKPQVNLTSPHVKLNYFMDDDDIDDGGDDNNDEVTPTNKTNMQKIVSKQMPPKAKKRADRIDDMAMKFMERFDRRGWGAKRSLLKTNSKHK